MMDKQDLTKSDHVLIEQASLCISSKLPLNSVELDHLLWKAFHLGKQYRDCGGKE